MIRCETCQRHHRPDEAACPFCRRRFAGRGAFAAGVAAAALSLSACYGGAPERTWQDEPQGEAAPVTSREEPR